MSTAAFPVFVIWSFCVAVVPTVTFPKATLAGLADSVSTAATPEPVSGTLRGELPALLVIETLPEADPAVVG
jgi:hypothetical protein